MVDVWTILESFSDMPLRYACFTIEDFSDKQQNFQSWGYLPQVADYKDFHYHTLN